MTQIAALPREAAPPAPAPMRSEGARALRLVDAARKAGARGVIHLAGDEREAERLTAMVRALAGDVEALLFPPWDCLPYDGVSPSREVMGRRMAALHALARERRAPWLLISTVDAVSHRVPPRDLWRREASLTVKRGDAVDVGALEAFLLRTGYVLDERVDEVGEAALRGQVIDIFPAGQDMPVRIEHEAGRIAGLCRFDPLTQRTDDAEMEALLLLPASEIVQFGDEGEPERFPGAEHWLARFHAGLETLFAYAPKAAIAGGERLEERVRGAWEQIGEAYDIGRTLPAGIGEAEDRRAVLAPESVYLDPLAWKAALKGRGLLDLDAAAGPVPRFAERRGAAAAAASHIRAEAGKGERIVLAGPDERQLRGIVKAMEKRLGTAIAPAKDWDGVRAAAPGAVLSMVLPVERGFALPEERIALIAAADILGQRARRDRQASLKAFALEQDDLAIGDTVIHLDHGMGVLKGLEIIEVAGETREMIRLEYADEAVLWAQTDEIWKIWRYGSDREAVSLDRLDGEAWPKRRAKVEAEIAETAERLVKLSAARAKAEAKTFTPKPGDYDRFAARFGYAESPDQASAIEETLADLASGRPMDRLVCGDVGFGKTEVALRAAAVVAMGGAQVAIAAPTTVLVRQHVETFRKRFAGFGLEIAQLSRLASAAEQREVRKGLAEGRIRIVIGTHALAGKDVRFQDLGLLVIDEEQRFGTREKTKLRQLGKGVHVLTLTATPIPRTLQAAMVGMQDLSVIATPPVRRRPIRTVVTPFDPVLTRQALLREKSRGGQSFFVCSRIEDMAPMAARLAELTPELKVLAAHGKMPAAEIDDVMMRFAHKEGDVLLATNIIESGLDLPNANTMMVWRADRFGLSQLHQLRGRAGRGRKRGAAYLMTDPEVKLSPATEKRLRTLETLDRLGAGFEISARDLDLRGAGDLIGEEQAGHIKLIGADLYRRLLERALEAARGGTPDADWMPDIDLGAIPAIPEDYVPEPEVRLGLYARLARLTSLEEVDAFAEEIEDRFGQPPAALVELLAHAQTAILCRERAIARVEGGQKAVSLAFLGRPTLDPKLSRPGLEWRDNGLILRHPTSTAQERYDLVLGLIG